MKHYNTYLCIVLVLLLSITSCKKDFLEVEDGSVLFRQDVVTNLKTTEQYLNGVYTMLGSDLYGYSTVIYPDLVADNIKPFTSSFTFMYAWAQQADEESGFGSDSKNVNGLSYVLYKIAGSCNFVLEKAEEFGNENPAKADALKGQAYSIRALVHFWLVNVFAQSYNLTTGGNHLGVAYVTSSDYTQPISRKTVAEVYDRMISDLNSAIQLLPAVSKSNLYISQNFAKALMARISLFKGDFATAKKLAIEVGNAVPIMTSNYPDHLFTSQETEALFQVPPVNNNYYSTTFAGLFFSPDYSLEFVATRDIAVTLQENLNDLRSRWVTDSDGIWYVTKFPQGIDPNYPYAAGAYYQTVLRSSEMYLTAAECYAQLHIEDSARYYLNAIRLRANPTANPTIATGAALLDSIYKERRKELAFESLRMFDLLRWKKGVIRTDASNPAAANLPYPSNKAIAPIPGLDVKLSGILQNPGY